MLSGFTYKPQVESQVVDGSNLHGQEFLCMKQMAEVCLAIEGVYS